MLLNRFFQLKKNDFKKIPIIINNFNRLTTLKLLIESLQKRGYTNIHILDNKSTYPPLLEYYKQITPQINIHHLKKNYGYKALWKSGIVRKFMFSYFCYTDSDLVLVDECSDDFIEKFYSLLIKYPEVFKVGFSLKIDDIPNHYSKKQEVIKWEKKFFEKKKESNVFIAPIDTTFAMYRPFSKRGRRDGEDEMLRVGFPYQCKHLPWYNDCSNLSLEEQYYLNNVNRPTHWSK